VQRDAAFSTARKAASCLRRAAALQNFFLLKLLCKGGVDGYFQPSDARSLLYEKEENYRTALNQKF